MPYPYHRLSDLFFPFLCVCAVHFKVFLPSSLRVLIVFILLSKDPNLPVACRNYPHSQGKKQTTYQKYPPPHLILQRWVVSYQDRQFLSSITSEVGLHSSNSLSC